MGKSFKDKPNFKKTKKPSKRGAFWGEGKLRVKREELVKEEEEERK